MRPGRAALVLSVLPAAIPIASSIAQAGPPRPASGIATGDAAPPLVGRARTRGGVVDLTRASLSEGGPAFELAPAVAEVMAEAADALDRESRSDAVHGARDPRR